MPLHCVFLQVVNLLLCLLIPMLPRHFTQTPVCSQRALQPLNLLFARLSNQLITGSNHVVQLTFKFTLASLTIKGAFRPSMTLVNITTSPSTQSARTEHITNVTFTFTKLSSMSNIVSLFILQHVILFQLYNSSLSFNLFFVFIPVSFLGGLVMVL